MSAKPNVMYPVNYAEPTPPEIVPDDENSGRDFARLRVIIRGSVPAGGTPMTMAQMGRIVLGAPNRGGGWVSVADSSPAAVRAAAFDESMGILQDPAVQGISRKEAIEVFRAVWAERESSWTFRDAAEVE